VFIAFVGELALLSVVELAELREGAAQPNFVVRGLGQVTRNKPRGLLRVPPLNDKVGNVSVAGSMIMRRTSPQ
jgi:hypothetical protein